jgi:hypothetical protein
MDSRESKERAKSVIVFGVALVVLVAWHPWVAHVVNGVQQSDVATSRP